MEEIAADKELNCRGMRCPLPVIYTRKALAAMSAGEVVKVICTDPGSITDMSEFSKRTGNKLLLHTEQAGDLIFFLRKAQ
jgi:tRNA 2-thiouridine synthesizing protein A